MTPREDASAAETRFRTVLDTLRRRHNTEVTERAGMERADPTHGERLVDEIVRSMLQWNASHAQARASFEKLLDAFVDYNELRICLPEEITPFFGARDSHAEERAHRLLMALNNIWKTEQGLSLARLSDLNKRDAKTSIDEIAGLPRFARARLLLLGLGAHAIPVDDRLLGHLISAGVCDDSDTADAASGRLERLVRAEDGREVYELLELWSADGGGGFERPTRRKTTPRTNKKKTSTKATGSA